MITIEVGRRIISFLGFYFCFSTTFTAGMGRNGNVLIERVPSLCGVDPYAQSKGYGSPAGATAIIMEKGYGNDYQMMKSDISKQVSAGQMGIQQAVCEYCYWFFSGFDGHVYVDNPLFMNTYFPKCHIRYAELFEYAPKPVSCKVNDNTWLIRVPSCNGQNPTFQWLEEAVQQYLQSGCSNLIIDIRGNTGGSDAIWEPVGPLLFDHQPASPEYTLFRNTPKNLSFYILR